MCQIIYSPNKAININREMVDILFGRNPDGIGFLPTGRKPMPHRWLPKSADNAWEIVSEHINGRKGTVHFRWRTDGDFTINRVHPFAIDPKGKAWLFHNGVLAKHRSPLGDPRADTQIYIESVLSELPVAEMSNEVLHGLIALDLAANGSNRFVICTEQGQYPLGRGWLEFDGALWANDYAGNPSDLVRGRLTRSTWVAYDRYYTLDDADDIGVGASDTAYAVAGIADIVIAACDDADSHNYAMHDDIFDYIDELLSADDYAEAERILRASRYAPDEAGADLLRETHEKLKELAIKVVSSAIEG